MEGYVCSVSFWFFKQNMQTKTRNNTSALNPLMRLWAMRIYAYKRLKFRIQTSKANNNIIDVYIYIYIYIYREREREIIISDRTNI